MAKHNKYRKENYEEQVISEEPVAPVESEVPVKTSSLDCTVLLADGGKSEFGSKGGPMAGLINEHTHCPACNGSGLV